MTDARFEDGGELPLRLKAESAGDLPVLAALVQDAVFTAAEVKWSRKARRLDLLVNRFRWEDRAAAEAARRPYERVRSILTIFDVDGVSAQGVSKGDQESVLSILSLTFTPDQDGAGHLEITLSGDGALRVQVECVNLLLTDVTRPYRAPSGKVPSHPED